MLGTLWQDIRYGVRMLWKTPVFTIIAVFALALGIGANTAIFSVVNAVLLRPLPFKDADRLMWVWETQPTLDKAPFTPADFLDYQAQNQSFEGMAAYFRQSVTLTGAEQPARFKAAIVTANFFSVLKSDALAGRTFLPEEGQPGARRVAVVSHAVWQRQFGSAPDLVGKTLTLNGVSFAVVGIMPPAFTYPNTVELWVNPQQVLPELSVGSTADVRTIRDGHWLSMVARLKPGVTVAQAQADMEAIARRIGQQHNSNHGVRVVSLHERTIGNVRPLLLLLLGAVGLVLLVACANVANLLLARHATRHKEMAVRTALGASRWRVVRQLLTESMLLACLGGAVGLVLAAWGVDLLKSALPAGTPRLNEIGLDAPMLGFTLAVALVTGLVFGVLPALRASDFKLSESLKEGARGTTEDFRRNRVRGLLVISEVALSLLVLIGASLLIKSFLHLQRIEPGFEPANLLTMEVSLPASKYAEPAQQTAFFRQMTQRLEALPGVRAVAVANDLPIDGDTQTSNPHVEGRPAVAGEQPLTGVHTVSPAYLQAMGIRLLKGREFTPADVDESPPVMIINETMARRLFPNEDPLGKRIKFSDPSTEEPWMEVVGMVGDVKHNGLDAEPYMETYVPFLQSPRTGMSIAVRTTSEPANLTAAVRQAVLEIDKDQPIYGVRTMEQVLSESVASRRLSMTLFSLLAGLALLLATVGIYGVIAYTVSSRTHEIGIRVALGAQSGDVLSLILKQGLMLILSGVAVGILTAFLLSRVLASLLFEVSATDPATFVVAPLLLVAVALLACYVPARRATKVDPMIALRYE